MPPKCITKQVEKMAPVTRETILKLQATIKALQDRVTSLEAEKQASSMPKAKMVEVSVQVQAVSTVLEQEKKNKKSWADLLKPAPTLEEETAKLTKVLSRKYAPRPEDDMATVVISGIRQGKIRVLTQDLQKATKTRILNCLPLEPMVVAFTVPLAKKDQFVQAVTKLIIGTQVRADFHLSFPEIQPKLEESKEQQKERLSKRIAGSLGQSVEFWATRRMSVVKHLHKVAKLFGVEPTVPPKPVVKEPQVMVLEEAPNTEDLVAKVITTPTQPAEEVVSQTSCIKEEAACQTHLAQEATPQTDKPNELPTQQLSAPTRPRSKTTSTQVLNPLRLRSRTVAAPTNC